MNKGECIKLYKNNIKIELYQNYNILQNIFCFCLKHIPITILYKEI